MKRIQNRIRNLVIFSFLLQCGFQAQAQVQHSGWLASFNTIKLDDKWSVHFDGQLRSSDAIEHVQTLLLRPGINYHFKKGMISGGYGFIHNRRSSAGVTGYLNEHRFWEQLILNTKLSRISTAHRFRFEQRFLPQPVITNGELKSDDFATAYRLRYFIRNVLPLVKQPQFSKGAFVALQNEVFLNTGDKSAVNGKFFDQNRFYAAVGYRLSPKVDVEAGYLNQYVEGRRGFTNNHIAQLALYTRL